jgi:hypothetical protein
VRAKAATYLLQQLRPSRYLVGEVVVVKSAWLKRFLSKILQQGFAEMGLEVELHRSNLELPMSTTRVGGRLTGKIESK